MTIIVTGSEGLVGERLLRRLAAQGQAVAALDVRLGRDIRDPAAWADVPDATGIVHLAAISRVAWGESHPAACDSINVAGTEAVVAAAERADAWLLFASSREVYGDPASERVREDDPLEPVNTYGRSKLAGERIVDAARARGAATATVRLSNVYGGGRDHPDRAVPSLVAKALAGVPLPLTGGDHFFDFTHVDDVVEGLATAIAALAGGERGLPTAHFASGRRTTLRALAEQAVAAAGSASPIVEVGPRGFDVAGFCGDPALAAAVYGWRATTPIEAGVAKVAADIARDGPPPPVAAPA